MTLALASVGLPNLSPTIPSGPGGPSNTPARPPVLHARFGVTPAGASS